MTYEVKLTGQAMHDLKMVYRYIADTLMEPVTAEKQYARIEKAIYSLRAIAERRAATSRIPLQKRLTQLNTCSKFPAAWIMRILQLR